MKRPIAIAWLLVTLVPLAYLVYFVLFALSPRPESFEEERAQFAFIARMHTIMIFGGWALIASYIVYLFKTDYVPSDKKALWAVVLFLGSIFAMPVFWFLYVWNHGSEATHDTAA